MKTVFFILNLLIVFFSHAQRSESTLQNQVDSILHILKTDVIPFIETQKEDQLKRDEMNKAECNKERLTLQNKINESEIALKKSRDSLIVSHNEFTKLRIVNDSLKKTVQARKVNVETFISTLDQQDHHIHAAILDVILVEAKELKKYGIAEQQIERITDFKRKSEALRFADDLINKNLSSIDQIKEAKTKLTEAFSKGQNFALLNQENKKFHALLVNYENRICELKDVFHIILDLSVMPLEEKQANLLKVISILDFKDYGFLNSLIQKFYLNPNNSVLPNYILKCS